VFSSLSILYRISLFSFPFAVVCVFYFFFFFRKNSVGLSSVVLMRCGVTTYALLFFLFIIFPSLPLAFPLNSLIAPRKETPARSWPYPYRTVSYYITMRILFSV